ncbi:MAG TPA: ABC transporter permease [Acidimicrobiales bacterium]|nr:ABC transporter permease [Acidimicrobiales bacterium]
MSHDAVAVAVAPPEPPGTGEEPSLSRRQALLRRFPESGALIIFLVVLSVVFASQSPYFMQWQNWLNILQAAAIAGIVAAPGAVLIISGNFDLSVGAGIAFCSVVFADVLQYHGLAAACGVSFACGLAIGLVNGFVVTVLGVNSLIATLGSLGVLQGLAEVITQGNEISINNFAGLGSGRPFWSIPIPVLILIGVIVVFAGVLRYTVFGRSIYAIGANRSAARLAGIRIRRNVMIAFVLSGLAVWGAAVVLSSQITAGSPTDALPLNLTVITAIILGGTALEGGKGGMLGVGLGVVILFAVQNGLDLANINTFWQTVVTGVLLILAVALDRLRVRLSLQG